MTHSHSPKRNTDDWSIDSIGSYDTETAANAMRTYEFLTQAFDFFNQELFDGRLPTCLITFQRTHKSFGYFWSERLVNVNNDNEITDEIALNPKHFQKRMPRKILSTLVHEMAHLWQHHFGKCGRGRYHNLEWARLMYSIGLVASDTGKPGGKPTGDRVSHYILEGGRFDRACATYLARCSAALFQDRAYSDLGDETRSQRDRERKAASKTRYRCSRCGQTAWAKPGARFICEICEEVMC